MKKRIISMIVAIVMVVGLVPSLAIAASAADGTTWDGSSAATSYESGKGTESEPYIIKTAAQLIYFRNQVNVGVKYNGQYFLLDADLDMNSQVFGDPIGKASAFFNGHFDGGNHKISNLKIGNTNGYSSLFGNVGYNGEQSVIKNLTLVNVNVNRTSSNYGAAAIVGNPRYLRLENCTVESGTIQCSGYTTGGLISTVNTNETFGLTVINCVNKATVTSTSADSNGTGGIIGQGCDNAQIIGCINYGNVTGKSVVAGIIGNAGASTVEKCANFGNIASSGHIGTKPSKAAGVLATNRDVVIKIENCYNAGNISSDGTTQSGALNAGGAGGIAVFNSSSNVQKTVANCYSVGNVTGNYSYPIALRSTSIENSYYLNAATKTNSAATQKTEEEFSNGTVLALLQAASDGSSIWVQSTDEKGYPTLNYTIEKATITADDFTMTNTVVTYCDSGAGVTVTAKDHIVGMGEITVKYYDANGELVIPVNAGAYTVKIDVAEGTNYNAATDVELGAFTISPKSLSEGDVSLSFETTTYNGSEQKPEITIDGLEENVDFTVVYGDSINAGTVSVTVAGIGNYTDTVEKSFTIEKATPNVSLTAPIDKVIGGSSIELNPASDASEVNRFEIVEGEGYSVNGNVITIDDGVVAGTTLTVKYRSAATENYDSVEGEITLTVGVPTVDTSALESAIDELEGSIDELEARLDDLNATYATDEELKAELDAIKTVINGISADVDNLKNNIFEEEIDLLKKALVKIMADVDEIESTYATKAELEEAVARLDELTKNGGTIDQINTEIARINKSLTALDGANRLDVAEAAIRELRASIEALASLETDIEYNSEGIRALDAEISELKTALETMKSIDHTLVNTVSALEEALDSLISRVNAAEKEITALKEALSSQYAQLSALIGANTGDIEAINEALEKINETITALATKTDVEAEIGALTVLIDALADRVKNTETDIAATLSDVSALQRTLRALSESVAAQNAALSRSISGLSEGLTALESRVAQTEADIAKLNDDLRKAIEELNTAIENGDKDLDDKIIKLSKALDDAVAALEQADINNKAQLLSIIDKAKTALGDAIDAVQKNLDDAKAELEKALADGDKALDDKIVALTEAMEAAQATLTEAIAAVQKNLNDVKAELENNMADGDKALDDKIVALGELMALAEEALINNLSDAQAALTEAIAAVQKNLDDAKAELEKALADGDKALDDKIIALDEALEAAKKTLNEDLSDAQTTLDAAIAAVQKNLDDAKAELEKALADGDKALDDKITALDEALGAAKKVLGEDLGDAEAVLDAAIAKVQKSLDDARAELDAKDGQLNTMVIVAIVLAGLGLGGNVALLTWIVVDKRKKASVK